MLRIHRSRRQDAGQNRLDDWTCRGGEEVLQTIAGGANRDGSSIIDSVKHGLANHILDSGIRFCVVKSKGGHFKVRHLKTIGVGPSDLIP